MTRDQSPYVELERAAWAALAGDAPQPLSTEEIERVRGLGDELDLEEVRQVYLPMTELISMRVRLAGALYEATEAFLHEPQSRRTPFVIGIAGSVAVGKSTTARLLRELLSHSPDHPHVELVTTDGFLLPNAELERRGLLDRKGFPESYDRKALLRFVMEVKSGVEVVTAPVYSHLTYDRTDEVVTLKAPDIVIVEGLNVLAPARVRGDGTPGLAISDFFDFSIYVDASSKDIRRWYVERFLTLAQDGLRRPGVVLQPLQRADRRRGGRPGRRAVGPDQLAQPAREHPDHPRPRLARAPQGPRPHGQLGPPPQALTTTNYPVVVPTVATPRGQATWACRPPSGSCSSTERSRRRLRSMRCRTSTSCPWSAPSPFRWSRRRHPTPHTACACSSADAVVDADSSRRRVPWSR